MRAVRALLTLLYPPKCPFCGRVLEAREEGLCSRCRRTLPWTAGQSRSVDFCDACLSPLWYREGVRRAVHRYKFHHGRTHAALLGTLMAQCLRDNWAEPVDAVVWVPLSEKHRRRRGYDQAELLARRVGEECGLPVLDALEKVRDTATQSRLERESQRRANVLGAYRVREGAELAGLRLVLVDDVVTSGATLSECASCLRMAGAESVAALTLARAK
ncbi:MAG: ComF family protein [Candidatus Enterenecus sp.]